MDNNLNQPLVPTFDGGSIVISPEFPESEMTAQMSHLVDDSADYSHTGFNYEISEDINILFTNEDIINIIITIVNKTPKILVLKDINQVVNVLKQLTIRMFNYDIDYASLFAEDSSYSALFLFLKKGVICTPNTINAVPSATKIVFVPEEYQTKPMYMPSPKGLLYKGFPSIVSFNQGTFNNTMYRFYKGKFKTQDVYSFLIDLFADDEVFSILNNEEEDQCELSIEDFANLSAEEIANEMLKADFKEIAGQVKATIGSVKYNSALMIYQAIK